MGTKRDYPIHRNAIIGEKGRQGYRIGPEEIRSALICAALPMFGLVWVGLSQGGLDGLGILPNELTVQKVISQQTTGEIIGGEQVEEQIGK